MTVLSAGLHPPLAGSKQNLLSGSVILDAKRVFLWKRYKNLKQKKERRGPYKDTTCIPQRNERFHVVSMWNTHGVFVGAV